VDGTPPAMDRLDDDVQSATEEGRLVSYVYRGPETGKEGRIHSWVVRLGGRVLGAGRYVKG